MRTLAAKIPMEVVEGMPLLAGAITFCVAMFFIVMSSDPLSAHTVVSTLR